jgi:2-polyprenyl-6-methoxyphenol hydroxylase-like FAD-dependent oxidoreductase
VGEVRARLTVGAAGRFSQIRRLSGARPVVFSSPIDVLWFRLPRMATDPEGVVGGAGHGHMLLMADRGDHWQIGSVIAKGEFPRLRAAGLDSLGAVIVDLVPWLAGRIHHLADWQQVSLLSVACDTLPQWWRPGLLMIGDAAHVMSPVAGNGINYAVQDAVAAANLLAEPLAAGHLSDAHLAAIQRRRQWPTRITQAVVGQLQDRALARMLRPGSRPPNARVVRALTRIPGLPYLPLRLAAFGLRPEHVRLSAPEGPSGQ